MCKNDMNNEDELFAMLRRADSVQEALDAASIILGNPIIIFGMEYNLWCHTENKMDDDPIWNEFVANGRFSHETVDFFKNERFIDMYAESDIVSFLKTDKLKYDRANGKLFDRDNIQIGNISVLACYRPLVQSDIKLIEDVCELLSEKVMDSELYHKIERSFDENIICAMIEGKTDGIHKCELEELCAKLKDNLHVMVIDVMLYESTLTHLVYFKDLFARIQSEYHYFVFMNNIVAIIDTPFTVLNIERDVGELNDFFNKYGIIAGVSACFQSIHEVHAHYKQALNALNYGLNSDIGKKIFQYDHYRLDCLLSAIKSDVDIRTLLNPTVDLMRAHDERHGTKYYDVLRAYLLLGGYTKPAAKMMGMNEADFCAQLGTLGTLFDIDWSDGNIRLSLFISVKVYECV